MSIVQDFPTALPAIGESRRLGSRLGAVLSHVVLLLGAAFILLPFVWMLLTSIRSPDEIFEGSFWPWPRQFYGVEHYGAALAQVPMLRFLLNGVIVCAGILVVQLLVAIPAAYAL